MPPRFLGCRDYIVWLEFCKFSISCVAKLQGDTNAYVKREIMKLQQQEIPMSACEGSGKSLVSVPLSFLNETNHLGELALGPHGNKGRMRKLHSVTFLAGHGEISPPPPTWVIHTATRTPAHNTLIHVDFLSC